jgi:hypothetical protein
MRYKERKTGYYGIQNKRSSESEKEGKCTRQDITTGFAEYFTDVEVEMLPSRMFKCFTRTESMGDFIKRNRKKK